MAKFGPNGAKIRFFVIFFKFGSLVFLEVVKIKPTKKMGAPKLGLKL